MTVTRPAPATGPDTSRPRAHRGRLVFLALAELAIAFAVARLIVDRSAHSMAGAHGQDTGDTDLTVPATAGHGAASHDMTGMHAPSSSTVDWASWGSVALWALVMVATALLYRTSHPQARRDLAAVGGIVMVLQLMLVTGSDATTSHIPLMTALMTELVLGPVALVAGTGLHRRVPARAAAVLRWPAATVFSALMVGAHLNPVMHRMMEPGSLFATGYLLACAAAGILLWVVLLSVDAAGPAGRTVRDHGRGSVALAAAPGALLGLAFIVTPSVADTGLSLIGSSTTDLRLGGLLMMATDLLVFAPLLRPAAAEPVSERTVP